MFTFSSKFSDDYKKEVSSILSSVLPDEYSYFVYEFNVIRRSVIVGETQFTLECRVNVETKEEIEKLLTDIGRKSGTSYNKLRGDKQGKGTKVILSGDRKCHHAVQRHGLKNAPPHSGSGRQPGCENIPGKNTCCPAKLKFSLAGERLHTTDRYRLSLTKQNKTNYPLDLKMDYQHNHSINSADALKYRPVSNECEEAFTALFKEDHSASSALAQYKKDLRSNNEENFLTLMADRSIMPDYMWVFHFHRKYIASTYGSLNGPDAYKLAEERVKNYNEKHSAELAKIELTANGEIIVAICDAFCRRVHKHVPQAGDIVLMDATSNLDRHDTKLFHLICPSAVGGLPLGNILTSKEDEETICAALTLFKSILPEDAFFGRGPDAGPKIIMTDDSDAERNAVTALWPEVILLLCIFHLLQAFWRWLWQADHKISKTDRPNLYNAFRALVFAKSDEEYVEKKTILLRNNTLKKYKNLEKHLIADVLPRKNEWALSHRYQNNLATHNVNTTNYVEVSFRLTKENQFNRLKAYNLPDLLDIILDDSIYYVNRCIDVGNNRTSQFHHQKSRYAAKHCNIDVESIVLTDPDQNIYLVPSESIPGKFYEVNMDIGLCECPQGMLKGPCKHKHVLAEKCHVASADIVPNHNPNVRAHYHFLATGERRDVNWYRALNEQDEVEETTDHMGIFDFMKPNNAMQNDGGESSLVETENNRRYDDDDNDDGKTSDDESLDDGDSDDDETDMSNDDENSDDNSDETDLNDSESDENDAIANNKDVLVNSFKARINAFSDEVIKRLGLDFQYYSKSVTSFTKQLKNVENMKAETFKKALHSFQNEIIGATKKGRKKKTGRNINVQNTAKSRRAYKTRGSTGSRKGRPKKDVVAPKRPGEPVPHCLPKSKKAKTAHPHSLSKSVSANRAAEKKH